MSESNYILTYRKLVKPDNLNHANTIFGGNLLSWADEAAAMYAMCQVGSKSVVTLKMTEVLFKNPAYSGDILEFWTKRTNVGRTSLGVDCIIVRKKIDGPQDNPVAPIIHSDGSFEKKEDIILSCEFSFVHLGEDGKPKPHLLKK
jgi:acyl-CoA hydrolase